MFLQLYISLVPIFLPIALCLSRPRYPSTSWFILLIDLFHKRNLVLHLLRFYSSAFAFLLCPSHLHTSCFFPDIIWALSIALVINWASAIMFERDMIIQRYNLRPLSNRTIPQYIFIQQIFTCSPLATAISIRGLLSGNICYETCETIDFEFVSRPRITNSLRFDRILNMSGRETSIFERAPTRFVWE